MGITYKGKDEGLREISEGHSSKCSKEVAAILKSDENISIIQTNMGDVYQITPKGKEFLAQGGYTAIEKEKERRHKEAEAAKEIEKQNRLQEIEIQCFISEKLMEKDHEFQARQNRANRRNNIVSGLIAAIISAIVAFIIKFL